MKFLEDIKTKKKLISQHCLHKLGWNLAWDVWSIQVLILQCSSKSVEQSANFEKCTFEKFEFQVFGGYKGEKNSYLSTVYTNLAEMWLWDVWSVHALTLQSSSKSIEQSANFEKCTLRKLRLKFKEDIKKKKFIFRHCLRQSGWNLAVRRLKYFQEMPNFCNISWNFITKC